MDVDRPPDAALTASVDAVNDSPVEPPVEPPVAKRQPVAAWKVVVVVTALVGLLAWVVNSTDDRPPVPEQDAPSIAELNEQLAASSAREVTYRVRGTAESVSITIETPGGTSQQANVAVPMLQEDGRDGLTYETFKPGDFLYLSAQTQRRLRFGDLRNSRQRRVYLEGDVLRCIRHRLV